MGAVSAGEVRTPAVHICAMDSWMWNGCACQIVVKGSHLLCLVEFGGLVCTKRCVSGSHAIDVMHFGKGGSPVGFPVGPNVVNRWVTFSLAPGQCHVATR